MYGFGTELTSLLHRANVYPINVQLDYLFEKLLYRIAEAWAHHDSAGLDDALRICTRLETRLQQVGLLPVGDQVKDVVFPVYMEQNFQWQYSGNHQ